jgi:uncharacterized protein
MAGGRGAIPNANRSYPPPSQDAAGGVRPWIMAMDWRDLLFMHWRIAPGLLRPFIPAQLDLETWDGDAWLGIVPFEMSGTRLRLMPPIPGLSRFPELNVRTYVRPISGPEREKPGGGGGVWFFSLDATSRAAVEAARIGFGLSYFRASMSIAREPAVSGEDWIVYRHDRRDDNRRLRYGTPRAVHAQFQARYRPVGPVEFASPGSLESFLTDRYRLYAWSRRGGGGIVKGEIHHPPWPLQPAEAAITRNTMAEWLGIEVRAGSPLLHFSRFVKVAAWWPQRLPLR